MYDLGWTFMILGGLGCVVLWVALIAGVVWVVRRRSDDRPGEPTHDAFAILTERFARGEIEGDEFVARRAELASQ